MHISRRRLLIGAAPGAVGAVILAPSLLSAAAGQTVYHLDPEWGAGLPGCPTDPHVGGLGCHACSACHGHSEKLFTSAALANVSRAHQGCKCLVASETATEREYLSYFGPPAGPLHRNEFDPRRDKPFLPAAPAATPTPGRR